MRRCANYPSRAMGRCTGSGASPLSGSSVFMRARYFFLPFNGSIKTFNGRRRTPIAQYIERHNVRVRKDLVDFFEFGCAMILDVRLVSRPRRGG